MPSMPGSPAAWPPEALDARLRALHDQPGAAAELSHLHQQAMAHHSDPRARRFHLTQAWVFALEAGDTALCAQQEADLKALGGL